MCTLDKIIELLKEQHKTQKDLTDFLGLTKNTFTNWKSGNNTSYKKYIYAIADYLNVSTEYLLGQSDSKTTDRDFILSEKEKRLVTAYRHKPEMHDAIDAILGLNLKVVESAQSTGKIAAFGSGPKDVTISKEALNDINKLPDA